MPEELITHADNAAPSSAEEEGDGALALSSRPDDIADFVQEARRRGLARISPELPGQRDIAPGDSAAEGEDEPGTFDDLFRRLRADCRERQSGNYKQFITDLADRVRLDWEKMLHGRNWQDVAVIEIEDGIVLSLFQKACARLTEEERGKLAAEMGKAGGNPNLLGEIMAEGVLALGKMSSSQTHLMRSITWELSKTGAVASMDHVAVTMKSAILGNVEITGSLAFHGELVFDGKLKQGSITGDSLLLGKNARVRGDVMADFLSLSGKINGNATIIQRCELEASAELVGDLTTPSLSMEEGATLVGRVRLGPAAEHYEQAGGTPPAA